MEKKSYLSNKIEVGEFIYDSKQKSSEHIFDNVSSVAKLSLAKAGLLNKAKSKTSYKLTAIIKDVATPSCLFGTCETGASVEYKLTNTKTKNVVYKELLIVPHNYEYPAFGANMHLVMSEAIGGAIGENLAHLIHMLSLKTKKDLL
jgi:hypothetical protein